MFLIIVITVGCCYLIFLSSELADEIDLFLVSIFTVSFVSVFEEDLDLSNEVNLFSTMFFFLSSPIGFSKSKSDSFFPSVFKLTIAFLILSSFFLIDGILEEMIFCFDLFHFFKYKTNVIKL